MGSGGRGDVRGEKVFEVVLPYNVWWVGDYAKEGEFEGLCEVEGEGCLLDSR
jgi:hypothetical protein